jgi:hypothetical protein
MVNSALDAHHLASMRLRWKLGGIVPVVCLGSRVEVVHRVGIRVARWEGLLDIHQKSGTKVWHRMRTIEALDHFDSNL